MLAGLPDGTTPPRPSRLSRCRSACLLFSTSLIKSPVDFTRGGGDGAEGDLGVGVDVPTGELAGIWTNVARGRSRNLVAEGESVVGVLTLDLMLPERASGYPSAQGEFGTSLSTSGLAGLWYGESDR